MRSRSCVLTAGFMVVRLAAVFASIVPTKQLVVSSKGISSLLSIPSASFRVSWILSS